MTCHPGKGRLILLSVLQSPTANARFSRVWLSPQRLALSTTKIVPLEQEKMFVRCDPCGSPHPVVPAQWQETPPVRGAVIQGHLCFSGGKSCIRLLCPISQSDMGDAQVFWSLLILSTPLSSHTHPSIYNHTIILILTRAICDSTPRGLRRLSLIILQFAIRRPYPRPRILFFPRSCLIPPFTPSCSTGRCVFIPLRLIPLERNCILSYAK